MNIKKESLSTYSPVPWEYREVIDEAIKRNSTGKIFYFCSKEGVCESKGSVLEIKDIKCGGMFILLDTGTRIRIDRIITLFGKPGAAYDKYDAFANACMDCMGG
ncbi:MAG TPA: hypothetical protein VF602_00440 [Pedobacter sp.]|jgi:hypothetical protein